MKRFGFTWFSYRDDEALLLESIKSVVSTMSGRSDYSLVVVEDGLCVFTDEAKSLLASLGVSFRQTFYPRNGNLIGQENLKGQLREMSEVAKDVDVVVKVDSDTQILNADWLDEFAEDKGKTLCGSFKTSPDYPMGNCYAIRSSIIDPLLKDVELYPAWGASYEDYEIGIRLHRLANGDFGYATRYRSGVIDGFWLCDPGQITDAAKTARVVSCGFSAGTTPLEKRHEYKRLQLKVMQAINAWRAPT